MVQFWDLKATLPYRTEYWKLRRHIYTGGTILRDITDSLDAAQYFHHKSVTKSRALALYVRLQRGLLSYDKYPIEELKRFATDRGLQLPLSRVSRSRLIESLELADDDATFDRFDDLPPEIRLDVFDLHFCFLAPTMDSRAMQPPVTLASRTFRHEALPLFFKDAAPMRLALTCKCFTDSQEARIAFLAPSQEKLERLSPHTLSCIKCFEIQVNMLVIDATGFTKFHEQYDVFLHLAVGAIDSWKNDSQDDWRPCPPESRSSRSYALSMWILRMESLLAEIVAREGHCSLLLSDIDAWTEALASVSDSHTMVCSNATSEVI